MEINGISGFVNAISWIAFIIVFYNLPTDLENKIFIAYIILSMIVWVIGNAIWTAWILVKYD